MAFRDPSLSVRWDRPIFELSKKFASFARFRHWAFWSWYFTAGERRQIGIRVLGLEFALVWTWMTEEEFEEFDQLRTEEQTMDCEDEPSRPEESDWWLYEEFEE